MMAKFAVFDAVSKLAYTAFPLASESVGSSLTISLVSGMIGKLCSSQGLIPLHHESCKQV